MNRGLLADPLVEVRCGVCSVAKFVKTKDKWNRTLNGHTSHLSKGEQMHWEFPDEYRNNKKGENAQKLLTEQKDKREE